MRDKIVRFKYQFILILVGILWIVFLNIFLQTFNQNYVYPDTESYIRASKEFFFLGQVDEIRPSIIAILTGLPLLFGFESNSLFLWNIILNITLWFSTILMIYYCISKFASKKYAFYGAIIYLFSIGSLLIVFEFLAETIFTFFILLTLLFLQKYEASKKELFLIVALSILVLSALVKPVSLALSAIFILFYSVKDYKNLWLNKYSFIGFFSILLLVTHMYSMKKTFGNFTISYIDTFTYYRYLGTRADCLKNNTEFNQSDNYRARYFNTLSHTEGKKVAYKDMKNQIFNNTSNFIKAYFINLKYNSNTGSGYFYAYSNVTNDSNFEQYKIIFRGISRLQNIVYTLFGLLLGIYFVAKAKTPHYIRATSFTILFIIGISAISSDQADRFHIVVYPFVIILLLKFCTQKTKLFVEPLQK